MGRKLKIFTGIILLLVGIAFIANVFTSYSLAGGFFGMCMAAIGIYLLVTSGKSEPKHNLKTIPAQGVKCSNCGNFTGTLNKFCPHCGSRMR